MGKETVSGAHERSSGDTDVALLGAEVEKRLRLVVGWHLINGSIEKNYRFKDFKVAIDFVNRVAGVSEMENHHPDILVWSWNNVKLTLMTHRINGLSDRDFVFASKVDSMASILNAK